MTGANPITERAVFGMFYERLMQAQAQSWLDAICTPAFRSDQDSEDYAWLGQVPQMSQLIGSKKFTQLRQVPWTVVNEMYQSGLSIPEKHVLYDKTDQIDIRVSELAERTMSHWWKLVADLIVAGPSAACYDGQYFFDTDHSEGDSGAQDNDISVDISALPVDAHGSVSAPSAGEMVHSIMTGINQMLAFKDDRGEYVNENLTDFLVMVPTSLSIAAMSALRARSIDGGDSNILIEQDSFRLRLASTPRLSSWTDKLAIFAINGTQKPFIRQQRFPNQAASGFDAEGLRYWSLWTDSEHCKKEAECLVNVESERAAAYGDWKKACLITLT